MLKFMRPKIPEWNRKQLAEDDPFVWRNPRLLADVSRTCFTIPKIFLSSTGIWPSQLKRFGGKFAFYIKLFLMVFLEVSQILYFVLNETDLMELSSIMSTLSTTLQGITKMTILYLHAKRLQTILYQSFFKFWPSNLMGTELEHSLKWTSNFVQINMISVICSAYLFAIGFFSRPLIQGTRELPFLSWYPFDYKRPYVYETLYLIQAITNMFIIVLSILGHDFIFLALSINVIAQFRILKRILDNLCSGNDKEIDDILQPIEGVDKKQRHNTEKQLLVKVIAHHQRVLFVCAEIENIFSTTLFVQLVTSVVAICVSSFLITAAEEIDTNNLYHLASYCLGHVLQLFLICAAGSEMAYQSESLCINAYTCYWYRNKSSDFRKSLLLIILRSQRAVKVTALGFFDLNYATFIAVMRLSFSFYTLLTGIIGKE